MILHFSGLGFLRNSEMGRNSYFQFKQFRIEQQKSAMKVGTDGVLLGAWVDVSGTSEILDIGTGTGLIALMVAQRSTARITAIEIEKNAYDEAVFNVSQSPWHDRINVIHNSFQEFVKTADRKFDLVVTNPPFFENDKQPADKKLTAAKHAVLLSFEDILYGVTQILGNKGRFAIILPAGRAVRFSIMAGRYGLRLTRLTEVFASPDKISHRWLMEFQTSGAIPEKSELIIKNSGQKDYTEAYKNLTGDFYLAF
jgi:tRNA1Val (adenine37-N6)-methyltransferase